MTMLSFGIIDKVFDCVTMEVYTDKLPKLPDPTLCHCTETKLAKLQDIKPVGFSRLAVLLTMGTACVT